MVEGNAIAAPVARSASRSTTVSTALVEKARGGAVFENSPPSAREKTKRMPVMLAFVAPAGSAGRVAAAWGPVVIHVEPPSTCTPTSTRSAPSGRVTVPSAVRRNAFQKSASVSAIVTWCGAIVWSPCVARSVIVTGVWRCASMIVDGANVFAAVTPSLPASRLTLALLAS